jgi:hypothetical protein
MSLALVLARVGSDVLRATGVNLRQNNGSSILDVRRLLLVAATVLLLAACGGGGQDRFAGAPFENLQSIELGGPGALGGGPNGSRIAYHDGAHIGLGIQLRNRSKTPVTLVGARVTDRGVRLIRQIGTKFDLVQERSCPVSCPPQTYLSSPYGLRTPSGLVVPAGGRAAVQLDFLVSGCGRIPPGLKTYARTLDVTYRVGGAVRHQLVAERGDKLVIYAPDTAYCKQPRQSGLVVMERQLATSSDWSLPVGRGDTCTTRQHGRILEFDSRALQVGGAPTTRLIRVRFTIQGFHGVGSYHVDGPHALRRRATVTTIGPNGTRVAYSGRIEVVQSGALTARGRLQAEFTQHRTRTDDRVYGGWWCAIAPAGGEN